MRTDAFKELTEGQTWPWGTEPGVARTSPLSLAAETDCLGSWVPDSASTGSVRDLSNNEDTAQPESSMRKKTRKGLEDIKIQVWDKHRNRQKYRQPAPQEPDSLCPGQSWIGSKPQGEQQLGCIYFLLGLAGWEQITVGSGVHGPVNGLEFSCLGSNCERVCQGV